MLTSLNSAHIGSDLTPIGLDNLNHPTEMQWDSVIYLAGQLNILAGPSLGRYNLRWWDRPCKPPSTTTSNRQSWNI